MITFKEIKATGKLNTKSINSIYAYISNTLPFGTYGDCDKIPAWVFIKLLPDIAKTQYCGIKTITNIAEAIHSAVRANQ